MKLIKTLLSILVLVSLTAQGLNLASTSAFINFVERVNSGTSYEGTTVLLNVDIEFTENHLKRFSPIGSTITTGFLGTFNGQGHVIRDLVLNTTTSPYAGLFGNTRGATIKNVILDSSCTITASSSSSTTTTAVAAAGILAYCQGSAAACTLENNVNMANVTYAAAHPDTARNPAYVGGIAGRIYPDNYATTVKNCANYGLVSFFGENAGAAYVGGIMGECRGTKSYSYSSNDVGSCTFRNCLNYGTVENRKGAKHYARVGGIVGSAYYTAFDSCVNEGALEVPQSVDAYAGALVGYAENAKIDYSFYSSTKSSTPNYVGHSISSDFGTVKPFESNNYELDETLSVGSFSGKSLVGALNALADMYYLRDYSNWSMNTGAKTITFTISKDRTSYSMNMSARLLLLPGLAPENKLTFSGWFTNEKCTAYLAGFAFTADTHLYTKWQNNRNKYTLSFVSEDDSGEITQVMESAQLQYLTTTSLNDDVTKNGCPIAYWVNAYGEQVPWQFTMPNHDVNLTAVWKCEWVATLDKFLAFAKAVNDDGNTYEGKTVVLTADIDFAEGDAASFAPIGDFVGTFDGQGHAIKNVNLVNTQYEYLGIFGRSSGTTIRNVVVADSEFVSSIEDEGANLYIGGIIGYCSGSVSGCVIKNVVSTAVLEYYGSDTSLATVYMGGIAGYVASTYKEVSIINAANYGVVAVYNDSAKSLSVGGIVGYCSGSSDTYAQIVNCLNYNDIDAADTNTTLYLGGIAGRVYNTELDFSVCGGVVRSNRDPNKKKTGAVCGSASSSYINSNLYSDNMDDANTFEAVGSTSSSTSNTNAQFNASLAITTSASEIWGQGKMGTTAHELMNSMVSLYHLRGYSSWLPNPGNKSVKFVVNGRTIFTTNATLILSPSLANADRVSFDGWYTDSAFNTKFDPNKEITSDTTFYGKLAENNNVYAIKFYEEGGLSVSQIKARYGTLVTTPETTRDDHVFKWWQTEYGDQMPLSFTMPATNIALYAVWVKTRIRTIEEFVEFGNNVNSGTNYAGETVYLENDLEFTEQYSRNFKPIGDITNSFAGTFDGQGHLIINLDLHATVKDTGLFGYSGGITIRNIVIDPTSSFTTTHRSSALNTHIAGIIGYCHGRTSKCAIENSVNMASFEYIESLSRATQLQIGGIVAKIESINMGAILKNCVNYGSIKYTGGDVGGLQIAGIVGSIESEDVRDKEIKLCRIVNCLNSGTVTHGGFTSNPAKVGGIIGYGYQVEVLNCVNTGKINDNARSEDPVLIGAIYGSARNSTIDRCYWDLNSVDETVPGVGKDNADSIVVSTAPFDGNVLENLTGTMNALNAKADEESWSTWGTNVNKRDVKFIINCRKYANTTSPLLMYPELNGVAKSSFYGWYTDNKLSKLLEGTDINKDSTLYAKWKDDIQSCRVNIIFNYNGNTTVVGHDYDDPIDFPQDQESAAETSSTTTSKLIWFTDEEMTNEYTRKSAEGYDVVLYGKKVSSRVVVTVLSLDDPEYFSVESFDEKGTISIKDFCLDELCENESTSDKVLDEDATLFIKK